ncbi:MAG: UDP-N-acetylmuramate dehydrogenase [Clostridia bacterium]|jgi:UDP-N-acetylmuramate dehydrogenase
MNAEFDFLYKQLCSFILSSRLFLNANLSKYTSFKIGGNANIMVMPSDIRELNIICILCKKIGIRFYVLGRGTNVLVLDSGINGVVIKTDKLQTVKISGTYITAEAGASIQEIVNIALDNNFSGLEWACGIPGSVGGAVYMNAGAYGGQMSDIVKSVKVYDNGKATIISNQNAQFDYRHSIFEEKKYQHCVILSTILKLKKDEQKNIQNRITEFTLKRKQTQNVGYPNAGSAFKKPKEGYAAKFIEDAGLKGITFGGAAVSNVHSGFIVNLGNATCSDVANLMDYISSTVYKKFNVVLIPEIKIFGG